MNRNHLKSLNRCRRTNGTRHRSAFAAASFILTASLLTVLLAACPSSTSNGSNEDAAPGAPTAVTATAGDGKVTLAWTAPTNTGYTGGDGTVGVITKYTVYYHTATFDDTNLPTTNVDTADGTTTTADVPSLTNGTMYYFKVTATNATGDSELSEEKTATPTAAVSANAPPGAPTSPGTADVDANGKKVTVSWTAPTDLGYYNGIAGVITGYTVYWDTSTGVTKSSSNKRTASAAENSLVIDGLTDNQTYYFVVTATTGAGESADSTEVDAAIPTDTTRPTFTLSAIAPATDVTALTITASETITLLGTEVEQIAKILVINNSVGANVTGVTLGADQKTVTIAIDSTEFVDGTVVSVQIKAGLAADTAASPNSNLEDTGGLAVMVAVQ